MPHQRGKTIKSRLGRFKEIGGSEHYYWSWKNKNPILGGGGKITRRGFIILGEICSTRNDCQEDEEQINSNGIKMDSN